MDDTDQQHIGAGRTMNLELIRKFMVVPAKQPNVVTWTAEACPRAGFWNTTPARGGQPSPLSRHITPSASEATSSRPSASAPGEKCPPALRIATKADAHSTTVTAAAPAARELSLTPPG